MPFDSKRAERAVNFFERYLRHTKGRYAGAPFILEDWQKDQIIRPIFGELDDGGTRRYSQVLLEIPRKNGKSEMAAGVALYLTYADDEPSAEVYSAAADREQAAIVYDVAEQMVRSSRPLSSRSRITSSRRNIAVPKTNSRYRVVSADGGRQHGLNPSGVIFDEVHVQRNRRLWDAMTMGSDTRRQPLVFAPTTAGVPDEAPVWWDLHEYARQCREGIFNDRSFLSVHYGAASTDDFSDPAVWRKVNPALGSFLSLEKFKAAHDRAKQIPSEWNEFLRYRLNVPLPTADRWIEVAQWDTCASKIDRDALRGRECVLGLDLSSSRDITALRAVFEVEGRYLTFGHYWLPAENVPERLRPWVASGHIETTPGNQIDYETIRKRINEFTQAYSVREVAYDEQFNAVQLSQQLMADGINVVPISQGRRRLNAATKEFETWIYSGRIVHDGDPVMRWMIDCTGLDEGADGYCKPMKPRRLASEKRIDGVMATIFAVDRLMRQEQSVVFWTV